MNQITTVDLPTVDIASIYNVKSIDTNKYRGVQPLQKQTRAHRGVFGGNLVAQSIVVAVRSAPKGFQPNSVHAYFVRPVNDQTAIDWEVEETTTGRTFANRFIRGLQNKKVVFTSNISLTKKNSTSEVIEKTGHIPLLFQRDTEIYYQKMTHKISECPIIDKNPNTHLTIRSFPLVDSRDVYSFLVKYGNDGKERIVGLTQEYQYAALGALSDWVALRSYFKNMGVETQTSFDVSLDHCIYFHDNGFDVSKYFIYSVKVTRLNHERVLFYGQLFNDKGVHVASVSQERLFVIRNKPKF